MRWMHAITAGIVGVLACAWVAWARRRYVGCARGLNARERAVMGVHFSGALLESVRIAEVERVELPGVGLVRWVAGKRAAGVLMNPGGIALGELVVVTTVVAPDDAARAEQRRMSLLFHELVHVAQYRAFGMRGFLTRYVRGWLENGREYFEIPLEREAYALQERFDAAPGDGLGVEGRAGEMAK